MNLSRKPVLLALAALMKLVIKSSFTIARRPFDLFTLYFAESAPFFYYSFIYNLEKS